MKIKSIIVIKDTNVNKKFDSDNNIKMNKVNINSLANTKYCKINMCDLSSSPVKFLIKVDGFEFVKKE